MRALVTGGRGFLGSAVARRLRERGESVRSLSRGRSELLDDLGVEQVQGDIADRAGVMEAARGCDLVFHCAAKAGVWGPYRDYYDCNVRGTQHVLDACREWKITRLVYTSSPSVVFAGRDQEGVDESAPYPARFYAHYPRTKAEAERMVLSANGPELMTVALRPHLIWGPGDNHLIPRLMEKARNGALRRVGNRANLVDSIYIDTAADAHIQAMERLTDYREAPAGRAYFLSQGEPVPLWDLVNRILAAGGMPPVRRYIPQGLAYPLAVGLECIYALLRRTDEPPLTRFTALQFTTSHWFRIQAAQRDFGFEPKINLEEGLRRLRQSFQNTSQDAKFPETHG